MRMRLVRTVVALGAVQWLTMARIVRGQALSIRRQEYVQAAEALGSWLDSLPPREG